MTDTSRAPERYVVTDLDPIMQADPWGGWVLWDDYRALLTELDARVAAAYEAAARYCRNHAMATPYNGTPAQFAGYISDPVDDDVLSLSQARHQGMGYEEAIRALTPADAKAALDRLIREAKERGAQREREACAEALWDACPLDRIVNIAYVKRAQDAIRNRGKRDE